MSGHNDGGPAFPIPDTTFPNGQVEFGFNGMTLRDYFAGKALQGLCANPGGPFQANSMSGWSIVNYQESDITELCYHIADAMLAEREKGGEL